MGSSVGTLSNGTTYGKGLSSNGNDTILLGGGALYIMPVAGLNQIPVDELIETNQYNVGWCESGAKIQYKPKVADIYNQYDQLVKRFITREDVTFKTGILTWNLANISSLSNATFVPATNSTLEKRVVFTGKGQLNTILLRFVYVKENGKKIRFTMIGQGGNGFSFDFSDKATSIDAEIQAIQYFENFLTEFREELSQEEFESQTQFESPNYSLVANGTGIPQDGMIFGQQYNK